VQQTLEELGLTEYAEVFAAEDIDSELFLWLGDSQLQALGVTLGHRMRLLNKINELKQSTVAAEEKTPHHQPKS
jgi:hypothetical protein